MVIAFHVLVVYALVSGLARKAMEVVIKPAEVKLVEEVKPPPPPPDTPPPPPPKLLAPPPPFIPPPEVQVQPQPQPATAIAAVSNVKPENPTFTKTQAPPAPPTEAKATGPVTIPGVIDFNVGGCKPEYPRASLRNEETGTVLLSVLIGADGTVADVKIDKSSGFRGLDNAVKSQLMSGSCKNKPGTVDGKPQQTWAKVQYVWKLE
ncbi:energy transducer TonB [Undibacterium sp. Ji42W]|uniref:energy transducer TonB n=1 Tax=Undibacterium sp. Ji42W TaxID=3413039 RepID=UPI003BF2E78D